MPPHAVTVHAGPTELGRTYVAVSHAAILAAFEKHLRVFPVVVVAPDVALQCQFLDDERAVVRDEHRTLPVPDYREFHVVFPLLDPSLETTEQPVVREGVEPLLPVCDPTHAPLPFERGVVVAGSPLVPFLTAEVVAPGLADRVRLHDDEHVVRGGIWEDVRGVGHLGFELLVEPRFADDLEVRLGHGHHALAALLAAGYEEYGVADLAQRVGGFEAE